MARMASLPTRTATIGTLTLSVSPTTVLAESSRARSSNERWNLTQKNLRGLPSGSVAPSGVSSKLTDW